MIVKMRLGLFTPVGWVPGKENPVARGAHSAPGQVNGRLLRGLDDRFDYRLTT